MGRALLIMVVGFSIIFSVYTFNITANQQRSTGEIVGQYKQSIARNAVESVTNVAISKLYRDFNWSTDFADTFNSVICSVAVADITIDSVFWAEKHSITTYATYDGKYDTTASHLIQPAFSHFYLGINTWDSDLEFVTGDTIMGPVFANTNQIRIKGDPVFMAKVFSTPNNWHAVTGPDDPEFYGGVEFGAAPVDFSSAVTLPLINEAAVNGDSYAGLEVWIDFNGTTYIVYSDPYITPIGVAQNLIDFNGTIYSDQSIHVRGTVDGRITVITDDRLWIEDDLVCAVDPSVSPTSDDFIGLVSEHEIWIADNANNRADLNMHAAIMTRHDELVVENTGTGARGTLTIVGSIVAEDYDDSIATDYILDHLYDLRFKQRTPPYFPRTNKIELAYRSN